MDIERPGRGTGDPHGKEKGEKTRDRSPRPPLTIRVFRKEDRAM